MKPKFNSASLDYYKGEKVTGEFILGSLSYGQSAKADWQNVTLKDRHGVIESKIWKQNMLSAYEDLVGHPVVAIGNVTERNGKAELSVEKMELCTDPDLKQLIEAESDAMVNAAVEYIRKSFNSLKNAELKQAIDRYLDDRLVADMCMYSDSRCYKTGAFWTEMASMIAMTKKVGTMASFSFNSELAYAAIFFYCYGLITYQELGELQAEPSKKARLTTQSYEACKVVEGCQMAEALTTELTHCCRAIGKAEEPRTAEAFLATLAADTYYKVSERRMNGF